MEYNPTCYKNMKKEVAGSYDSGNVRTKNVGVNMALLVGFVKVFS